MTKELEAASRALIEHLTIGTGKATAYRVRRETPQYVAAVEAALTAAPATEHVHNWIPHKAHESGWQRFTCYQHNNPVNYEAAPATAQPADALRAASWEAYKVLVNEPDAVEAATKASNILHVVFTEAALATVESGYGDCENPHHFPDHTDQSGCVNWQPTSEAEPTKCGNCGWLIMGDVTGAPKLERVEDCPIHKGHDYYSKRDCCIERIATVEACEHREAIKMFDPDHDKAFICQRCGMNSVDVGATWTLATEEPEPAPEPVRCAPEAHSKGTCVDHDDMQPR